MSSTTEFEEDVENHLLKPVEELLKETVLSDDDQQLFKEMLKEVVSQNSSLNLGLELENFVNRREKDGILCHTTTEVPSEILKEGNKFELKDIKIKCRGPDDRVYAQNKDLQQCIPRGLTLLRSLHATTTTSPVSPIIDAVIFANRKFTGGIGDEDDTQPDTNEEWKKLFLKDVDTGDLIISTEKVNGEAAHCSGRFIGDQFYIFTGSKNVHMMIRNKDDIKLYLGQRYCTALVVAEAVCRMMESLSPSKRLLLQYLLHYTRGTLVCELLQRNYQHLVNLNHLDQDKLYVIALTCAPPTLESEVSSLTTLPVHLLLEVLRCLGLDTPEYEQLPADDSTVLEYSVKVRGDYNTEGRVLYYLQGKQHNTIGMCKLKTAWYTVLRAIREKAVYGMSRLQRESAFTVDLLVQSSKKRLREIQDWLKFSDTFIDQWQILAGEFMRWLNNRRLKEGQEWMPELRPQFPVIWEEFLTEQKEELLKKLRVTDGRKRLDNIAPF